MTVPAPCVAPLFVPGDRPERFAKAANAGADAVILDLEDAVAPIAKAEARRAVADARLDGPVFVRINAIGAPWHEEDLAALAALPLAGIVVPKAEDGPALADLLARTRHPVVALIETARGLASARTLAGRTGIARLAFGSIDYCADLGCAHTRWALLVARSELVLASRLAGLPAPLDGVTAALDDPAAAEDAARHAAELGFGGKLCIHPRQVDGVLRGFMPNAAEVAWARKVVQAGDGVSTVEGMMIDLPVRRRAEALLARLG